jgi:hypothetical protein
MTCLTALKKSLIIFLGMAAAVPALADSTNSQPISQVLYNGTADYLFVIGTGSWVASGCSAYYIQITPSVGGANKILSIAMAAYAMGKNVQFYGTCDAQAGYFDAYYIVVSG